jgi:hypothetical protein
MTEPHPTADGPGPLRSACRFRSANAGGQKLVLAADGTINTWAPPSRRIDNAMVKAVARAFRWCEMLETGTHGMINETYVGRVLLLTLLVPDIVEAIMIGRQSSKMTLAMLMRRFPTGWPAQRDVFR